MILSDPPLRHRFYVKIQTENPGFDSQGLSVSFLIAAVAVQDTDNEKYITNTEEDAEKEVGRVAG
jgi:hypothetical protein